MASQRRVVITGMGVVSPVGVGLDSFWENCLRGNAAFGTIPEAWKEYATFKSTLWAPLPELDFGGLHLSKAERMQRDPSALLALLAATAAVEDAGLSPEQLSAKDNTFRIPGLREDRAAVFIGTGIGGIHTIAAQHAHHLLAGPKKRIVDMASRLNGNSASELAQIAVGMKMPLRFSPFTVSMVMPNALSAAIGIKFSFKGQNHTLSEACAAGTAAIGQGFNAIRAGRCDIAITGGAELINDEFGTVFRAFDLGGVLLKATDNPAQANRPFDASRSGMLLAEGGAGILVIEELEHALRRGAPIYAEITGFGETFDAHSLMMIEPSGQAIKAAQAQALEMAGLDGSEIDYLNAHGTGTQLNDEIETRIISETFGERVLVNSTKSVVGHSLGASGGIEAVATALSIKHQTTHACVNLEEPIANLNFVTEVTDRRINAALSESFAFGGHNAVLVLREWAGAAA